MALTSTITTRIDSALSSALDLATASVPLALQQRYTWASGTAADQADLVFHDQRTIAASSNEDLDLAGSLSDAFGATLTFVDLKLLYVAAASGNTNNVRVTRPASNGVPLFLAASDGIDVLPGGMLLWVAPAATTVTVTAGTGDLINVANSSSGTSVTYDVVIIGTSA
ncbi:hypothetical protein QTQ03_16680 [Micromonospora sp. WMMA1363]|uniref:hypothetical protein n=1 Tax=Micromonospora sp. WMMA1363 TaxID=3053985 RepID=UPI00259D1229|nr:hypothetical protein [Micromonospora sp. WMMA1363]MDM4721155.1 hypothetical protein [Micromonospora sp. WMMA1363]